jgi:hypothetical protein
MEYPFTLGFGVATAVLAVICFACMGVWWGLEVREGKLWQTISTADPKSQAYQQAQAEILASATPEHLTFYGGIISGALGVCSLVALLIAGIKEGSTAYLK